MRERRGFCGIGQRGGWDFSKARKLVEGVSRHLGDTDWATKLLKDAAGRVQGFASLATAAELLPDADAAKALVGEMLAAYEQQMEGAGTKTAYD